MMLDMQKRLNHLFYATLSLPATAMGFALCIQISALSWILSTRFNLEIHQIGIVWAAGPLAGIFGQVIIGLISDDAWFWGGRRRPFILIGGTLAALMVFLLPRIDVVSHLLGIKNIVIVAVIIALTLDLSINISFNPTRSIIADLTPEGEARTRGYTWMQTISGFFGVAAYIIGATLGNDVLISVGAGIVFVFSVVPMFFIKEERELVKKNEAAVATKADWGQLWRIYIAHGFAWLGVQAMFVYTYGFIQQQLVPAGLDVKAANAMSGQVIAYAFAVLNTVGFLLPALVLAPLARRFGRVHTQAGCVAIMALGYFLIATMARTPMMLYALMAVVGIGWSAIVSLPFAIMSDKVDKSRMGFFMGVFNLSVVLPQLMSTGVGFVLKHVADQSTLYVICGTSLAISAALWCLVKDEAATTQAAMPAPVH
ncbi:Predicted maltose transporter MalT [Janthinobacterium sp. CG23_2]|nr:MFS transporter [Massilia sp. H27-R4]CUI05218.1 Predicted maltose transporter MalT [Janthinobacterium sp. CG23_2]CUU29004.1 Predicted maltose transporter MalT [Janthinobacterium sp. CG23_2]